MFSVFPFVCEPKPTKLASINSPLPSPALPQQVVIINSIFTVHQLCSDRIKHTFISMYCSCFISRLFPNATEASRIEFPCDNRRSHMSIFISDVYVHVTWSLTVNVYM